MKKRKLIIILISAWIVSLILVFIIGKYSFNYDKTKNELKTVKEELIKMKEIEEKYKELSENQKEIITSLENEKENSVKYITSIKEINSETKIKLEHLEQSSDSTINLINALRESNKVLRNHFDSISTIIAEETNE